MIALMEGNFLAEVVEELEIGTGTGTEKIYKRAEIRRFSQRPKKYKYAI